MSLKNKNEYLNKYKINMEQKKYALNVTNLKDVNSQEDLEYPLYIGEWCKNSLTKNSIEKEIETAKYHWNDTEKFNKDFFISNNVFLGKLLPSIKQNQQLCLLLFVLLASFLI